MYIGGMAGTGKSQVIKALTAFFNKRNEEYRLRKVAPTGSAAALIGGSTYHSVLRMSKSNQGTDDVPLTALTEIQANLQYVDYIFMDEVSMLDCAHLYDISNRLCKTFRNKLPFGGKNVIFAGDFAQLAPVNGIPLYGAAIHTGAHTTESEKHQREAIGKVLWHQFTVVVLLRQNMRQKYRHL